MRVAVTAVIGLTLAACARDDAARPAATPTTSARDPGAGVLAPAPAGQEVAIVAGGCFWGMEDLLRDIPGVVDTEVGYSGDAEAVRVVFDPARLSYADLLERWYFRMHDPTTPDRQGNDVGPQYRSAIFYTSETQRVTAEAARARAGASGRWTRPIVTEIVPAGEFTPADASHQDYLERNPDGYTCHYLRD